MNSTKITELNKRSNKSWCTLNCGSTMFHYVQLQRRSKSSKFILKLTLLMQQLYSGHWICGDSRYNSIFQQKKSPTNLKPHFNSSSKVTNSLVLWSTLIQGLNTFLDGFKWFKSALTHPQSTNTNITIMNYIHRGVHYKFKGPSCPLTCQASCWC